MEIFDEVQNFAVPDNIFSRVKNAYRYLGDSCRIPEVDNQMEKVPLIVTVSDVECHIDVFLEYDSMEDDGNRNL